MPAAAWALLCAEVYLYRKNEDALCAVTRSTGLENEKNDQTGEITGKDSKGCASVRPYLFGAGSRKGARYSRGAVSLQRAAITDLNSRGARAKRQRNLPYAYMPDRPGLRAQYQRHIRDHHQALRACAQQSSDKPAPS